LCIFFLEHINYVKNLIGIDHVGIGADYDGVDEVPDGLEDVSKYPALFDMLAEDGHGFVPWTAEELKKLAFLNFIRVFKAVEHVRDSMKDEPIIDDPISYNDVIEQNPKAGDCRTDLRDSKTRKSRMIQKIAQGF
jgi:membrane dipeptidase